MQPRADPRLHLRDDLLEQQRGLGLLAALGRGDPGGQLLLDDLGDDGPHGVGAQHLLGLALELRLGEAHRDHRGQAGEHVVLLGLVAADLEPPAVDLELLAEHLEQGLLEPGQVGAALGRGDDVDERADLGVVAGPPAHGDVDRALPLDLGRAHVAVGVQDRNRLGERAGALQPPHLGHRSVGGEELGELGDAAVVDEGLHVGGRLPRRAGHAALVTDDQGQAGDEEGGLAGPRDQPVVVELGVLEEDLLVRPVADPAAGHAALGLADDRQLAGPLVRRELVVGRLVVGRDVGEVAGLTATEAHRVGLAAAVDLDVEPGRQRR